LEAELAALRDEVQQKAWALAQQQANVENLTLEHRSEMEKLQARLAEEQRVAREGRLEIEQAQTEARSLKRRVEELEAELMGVQRRGSEEAEELRRQFAEQIDALTRQLAQKSAEIEAQAASHSATERSLRDEIERLVHEARERNQILQDRNDEVVRVKTEMDLLLDRVAQLEASAAQAQASLAADTERMRAEFQAQLALLQVELSQKEWALEERKGVERQLREEVESFRKQIEEVQRPAKEASDEFFIDESAQQRREQFKRYQEEIDSVIVKAEPSFPASKKRRWGAGFGWKRRWKNS
jgi:chromosome segregation ATPase